MLLVVLSGFILAALTPFVGKIAKTYLPWVFSFLPVLLFSYFLTHINSLSSKTKLTWSYEWVPSLGINLDFELNGLSMLFALMITGIGSLVYFYSIYYLKGHPYIDRFYGYLSMFMASMLGVVLSDNLLVMFIFWELTSISSFFLIGFNNEDPKSRKSALTALSITGLGGLVLLVGILLLQSVGGTYSFSDLAANKSIILESSAYTWIVLFIFIGSFTKSAQFPFHFWLPGAMKAPTPVSTYLHSATMVKAGIFLLAKMTPLLGSTALWNQTLLIVGGITMVYAAIHALFRIDLKGILAYSTISALGMLVFLIGVGTEKALLAASVFILTHALYKAALFLITGIIDHQTGTRDITKLQGLQHVMKPVAIAGYIAALSSAGFPLFLGFLSKELMYESTFHNPEFAWLLTSSLLFAKILLLVAGFWAGIKPFSGSLSNELASVKGPSAFLWIPPVILGIGTVLFGAFPALLEKSLMQPVYESISGNTNEIYLSLWHGFNWVLLLSILTLIAGTLLFVYWKPTLQKLEKTIPFEKISPQTFIENFATGFWVFAGYWTRLVQNGYLRNYVLSILAFLTIIMGYRLYEGVSIYIDWNQISAVTPSEVIVVTLMIISILFAILSTSRTASIVALGVIGFANCLFFLFYSAPDLAMTQFSIDTLTVLLFMLVLFKLPKNKVFSSNRIRVRDAVVSILFGLLIAILTLEVFVEPSSTEISEYYANNAYILAKGRNVVNVILVDFRGMDTLVETTVLIIAAIGVFSLIKLNLNPAKDQ
ncbi:putative monovalent cation/H+ antiporter subunit A [Mongoliitalea daihaiensis]|uniref:putative monovalent cation/H+ antiporter subunit A n=1 Tax=Mongoliitalea daihaiensis TaxID=2782006 RepID=UPI001F459149|nr:putative monovalent cation/H+ antiporter subunit A [Mongoliitalea daihaiensis]UJP64069.1 putative monovalent cation/H+ antiporter subunit A [Mongoliitalea daihaiensis]